MKSLFLILLLTPLALFAQNAKIDSLKRVIAATKADTVKGRTLCRLCGELRKVGDLEGSLPKGNEGLAWCQRVRDRKGEGNCLQSLGNVYKSQGDLAASIDHFQRALKIREELGDLSGAAQLLKALGSQHMRQGDYSKALDIYLHTIEVSKESGDSAGLAAVLNDAGIAYVRQGNAPKALEYFLQSLRVSEHTGNRSGIAFSLNSIGTVHSNQANHAEALDYYQKSLAVREQISDQAGAAQALNNIGTAYVNLKEMEQAARHYRKSIEVFERIGNQEGVAAGLVNLADIYQTQGNHAKALEYALKSLDIFRQMNKKEGISFALSYTALISISLGQYKTAREYALQSLAIAQAIGHLENKRWGAEALYRADSALGDWKDAFHAHRLFKIYSDSLKNDESSQELGRLESKAEYEKQTEIDRMKAEEERLRLRERYIWMLGSAGGGLALLLVIAFTLFRGRRKEKRANAELRALNDRIGMQKNEIEAQNSEINAINAELQASFDEVSEQRRSLAVSNRELKETQERLVSEQSSREQAQRMAGIGEISTIIAHEVNTPLGAIKGGAQNLIDRLTQNASAPELQPLIDRAALAQPLSSREERAALRKLEPLCVNAGFAKPEEAARQLVNCGLHDLEDEPTLALLAREPGLLTQLAQTGAFMAQAANIQRAAERAANIVSALKTYSTLAGGPSDENAGASVADTLGLVLKLYDYYLSQGIELKIDPMDGLPDVMLDAGALSQVWTKLLLNSIYGMNRKGRLEIRFQTDGGFLHVLWQDDGPAPDGEMLARAFEPGTTLRDTDPPIDLSLCRAFVEGEAGGRIMTSIPADGGLVVELLLPKVD